jgi:phage replication O-like protein O
MTGFTKIDNDILEEMAKRKFNGTQYRIIFALWRNTYGWQQEARDLSLSFFSEATGIEKSRVKKDLNKLIDSKVITVVQEASFNRTRVLSFNKNSSEWLIDHSVPIRPQGANPTTGDETDSTTGGEIDHTPGGESDPQERKSKENSKEMMIDQKDKPNPFGDFEKLFGYLPSGIFMNQINDWIDHSQFQDPEAIICETIKRAKLQTPNNPPAYINSVLKKLHDLGLFTLAAVQEYNANFDRKIQSKKKNAPRSLFEQGEESKRRQNEPFELSPEEEAEIDAMLPF